MFERGAAPPSYEERTLLASFADQAGLALDRAQAIEERAELAVTSDRERIARDLHDQVIQRLFATGLQLQAAGSLAVSPDVADRIDQAVDALDLTIKDIRGTIFELQRQDHEPSLRADLRQLAREYSTVLTFSPIVRTPGRWTPPCRPRSASSCCRCSARRCPTWPGTRPPTTARSSWGRR